MDTQKPQRHFSMKAMVLSCFLIIAFTGTGLALALQYSFGVSLAKEAAQRVFSQIAEQVSERIHNMDEQSSVLVNILSEYPVIHNSVSRQVEYDLLPVLARSMELHPYVYSIYLGHANGDFYGLINLESDSHLHQHFNANAQDRWVLIHIFNQAGEQVRESFYYDAQLNLRSSEQQASNYLSYDRPWYRDAILANQVTKTKPYMFSLLGEPGVTYSKQIAGTDSVIAVDVSLSILSEFLKQQRTLPESEVMIFDQQGRISAHSYELDKKQLEWQTEPLTLSEQEQAFIAALPALRVSNQANWPPFDYADGGQPYGYSVDIVNLIAAKIGLNIEYINGYSWLEIMELFEQGKIDLVQSVFKADNSASWGLYSQPYSKTELGVVVKKDSAALKSMAELNGKIVAMTEGRAWTSQVQNSFPEIKVLLVSDNLAALKAVDQGLADAAIDSKQSLSFLQRANFLQQLQVLAAPQGLNAIQREQTLLLGHQQQQLQSILNRAISAITPQEYQAIEQRWLGDDNSNQLLHSINASVVPHPSLLPQNWQSTDEAIGESIIEGIQPFTTSSNVNNANVNNSNVNNSNGNNINTSSDSLFTNNNAQPEQSKERYNYSFEIDREAYLAYAQPIDSQFGQQQNLAIVVPLKTVLGPYVKRLRTTVIVSAAFMALLSLIVIYLTQFIVKPVNQLAQENEKIKRRDFKSVRKIHSNIKEIAELSESIVAMSSAIEQHQASQQELLDSFTRALAQAIDQKSPYTGGHCERVPALAMMLAEQAANSNDAAFKDFKLENPDQWREFEMAAWLHDCGKVTTPEHIVDKGSKLETVYNRIHEVRTRFEVLWRDAELNYWQGIAAGKNPTELAQQLTAEQQRLQDEFEFIAQCNIGEEQMPEEHLNRLSSIAGQTWLRHFDDQLGLSPVEQRRLNTPPASLPAVETLLADLPKHLVPWPKKPEYDKKYGFQMDVPDYQANLGELYNLSIRSGTLSKEDRYRINEHIMSTIQILNELALPEDLSHVPEYAGGHHETLIGTGYPCKLKGKELPTAARIIAIADVFEALTADDRPYKKAKTLSESLDILYRMAERQHLDIDLVQLLVESGVYRQYAERFLHPHQLDEAEQPNHKHSA
ncbi:HD domain-containing phosphohydrolase [Reinekea thalattae]|uniref:Transporter substrate-binding domain-containing protein n=1 Tax=Reinekea thalattae TaxID=2593301 RepID=A0A5C8Z7A7_9GAMM|nr:HD domain-containing phosphohydrolase [Reinekea thalattae]TXR53118.1 transporter substrate-binding domain-containing protein [Reinekea thalattae]